MSENKRNIELRSEKVRNIIGQIPSRIVRMGIAVIFVVILALLAGAYFFRFNHTIKVPATLYSENNQIHYTLEVPQNNLKHVSVGQKLVITVHNQNSFTTTIQQVDTTLHINRKSSYFKIRGTLNSKQLTVDEELEAIAKIYAGKTNVIGYILK